MFSHVYALYIYENELVNITHKLNHYGIQFEPFKGTIGIDCELHKKYKLTPGSFGHVCSFISILQDAIKNNYENILVIEPDVYFCSDFADRFVKRDDFKLYYLGASQNKFYREETWPKIEIKDNYYNPYKTLGTFALAIDNSVYQEIIDLLVHYEKPTDVALIEIQEKYNKECYVAYPNVICCDVIHSTTSKRPTVIKQLDIMKNYRWTLKYDIFNLYKLTVNGQRLLSIDINGQIGGNESRLVINGKEYKPLIKNNKVIVRLDGIGELLVEVWGLFVNHYTLIA